MLALQIHKQMIDPFQCCELLKQILLNMYAPLECVTEYSSVSLHSFSFLQVKNVQGKTRIQKK